MRESHAFLFSCENRTRNACDSRMSVRVRFSHVRVLFDSRNVQKRATKSDTSGHCLQAEWQIKLKAEFYTALLGFHRSDLWQCQLCVWNGEKHSVQVIAFMGAIWNHLNSKRLCTLIDFPDFFKWSISWHAIICFPKKMLAISCEVLSLHAKRKKYPKLIA